MAELKLMARDTGALVVILNRAPNLKMLGLLQVMITAGFCFDLFLLYFS